LNGATECHGCGSRQHDKVSIFKRNVVIKLKNRQYRQQAHRTADWCTAAEKGTVMLHRKKAAAPGEWSGSSFKKNVRRQEIWWRAGKVQAHYYPPAREPSNPGNNVVWAKITRWFNWLRQCFVCRQRCINKHTVSVVSA
jgi:hypothetical protein